MSLCRIATPGLGTGWDRRWAWLHDGMIAGLSLPDTATLWREIAEHGLSSLQTYAFGAPMALDRIEAELHGSLIAPIGPGQEVWAAGVTYESSKLARMAESGAGGDFYARVYAADRPELFFKATPDRVAGPNAEVRIRADSGWDVPEPELAALIAPNGRILGYTIANDMSSRQIEGANPLYLPQAKVYRRSCALGPWIVPAESLNPHALAVRMTIARAGGPGFAGETSTSRMRRTVEELASWLFRENDFPAGVFLLTGTGIVPPDDFTLRPGDEITIEIEGIGVLRNTVAGK